MGIWNAFFYFVVITYMTVTTQQANETGTEVFSLSERMELPLRFCNAKHASVDSRHAYDHCMRRWNETFAKFCKDMLNSGSKACERLKKKMENAIEKFNMLRQKSSVEHCDVGRKKDKTYDPAFQFCCENHIWKKHYRDHKVCCNKLDTNGTKITCCNASEIDLSTLKKARCCYGNLIDENTEVCDEKAPATNTDHLITIPLVSASSASATSRPFQTMTTEFSYLATNSKFNHKESITPLDANYKGRPQLHQIDHNKVYTKVSSNTIVYICVAVVTVTMLIVFVVLIKRSKCSSKSLERECFSKKINTHSDCTYGALTTGTGVVFTNRSLLRDEINQRFPPEIGQHPDVRTNGKQTVACATANTTMIEMRNMHFTDLVTTQTQTDTTKEINIKNSMGREFCFSHTFTISNRSLQMPDSAVILTLADADIEGNSLQCYASTFRNLWENYLKLDKVMSNEEQIVSPAVEYCFPAVKRLKQFACVVMPIGRSGKDFHVWKIKSDQGKGKSPHREEIPVKKYVDITDDTLDAYYEMVDGKIRIYVKSFSWLVCTVCNSRHYGFNLAARIYTKTEPHTEVSKQVRVTVYILDGVRQLEDYLKIINEDECSLKLYRNINLPTHASLEDSLAVHMLLLSESSSTWKPLLGDEEDMNYKEVAVHSITQCHKIKSNGQPFCIDWHYVSLPYSIEVSKFTFQCVIKVSVLPQYPGVNMDIPSNRYIINEEVDFSTVKKRARRSETTERSNDIEHRRNLFQHQVSEPRSAINYEALGARPRTTNRQGTARNIQGVNSIDTERQNNVHFHGRDINCSSNNCHDSRCRGALPRVYSESDVAECDETGGVRGEFES
ncbi:uncharacterized protein LOC123530706 [Mercenaria mercenaria]|uniref:uncharacterized protein LOC123530706 n=1 Tax=Mercenaria mercenaria TaxID=6596 RepID=UPI00234E5F91|nr:uncharacterized protein LOC123530706 [Mercenaria mercenaria]